MYFTMLRFAATAGLVAALAVPAFGSERSCASVYLHSVANVQIEARENTERSFVFNLYCEQNGEMRSAAGGGSFSFPIKGIPISLSAEGSFSESQMREFCRVGHEQNFFQSAEFGYNRFVSEAALRSFNDCISIEQRQVRITHEVTPPDGLTIFVELSDARQTGYLNSLDYNPEQMTCTTAAFSETGEAETLNGSMRREIRGGMTFHISCRRIPQIWGGAAHYPQANFLIGTSWGSYAVPLPGDTHYGFELASHARAMHAEVVERLSEAQRERDTAARRAADAEARAAADRRLANLSVFRVVQGDNRTVAHDFYEPCAIHGGANNVNTREYMTPLCRSREMTYQSHRLANVHAGRGCNHSIYALICVPN
jgi:hypothetical protein